MKDYEIVSVVQDGISYNLESGVLFYYDDETPKSWGVELDEPENAKQLEDALRNKEKVNLTFKTNNGETLSGRVLIKRINTGSSGTFVELVGDGALNFE